MSVWEPGATRRTILFFGPLALAATASLIALVSAAKAKDDIPQFASMNFGWQTNNEDWAPVPGATVHGPIHNDPKYPFINNAEGNRTHTQTTVRISDTKDPIFKPWAAAQIEKTNQEILSGEHPIPFTAQSRCWPGGTPAQSLYPFEPVYFIQTPKEVWMIWQRDHVVRRIFLNVPHSKHVTPSWFGESVGHYENGDTLVIDTIGIAGGHNHFIDNYRTPHTDKMHVVERFTIHPDGRGMTGTARIEDPDTFTGPLIMQQVWFKVDYPMLETVCPENNLDFFHQNLFPIPEADTPDF
jgi:hypothetical protein